MKIRNGFVSNSSTTSFCIYGTTVKKISEQYEDDYKIGDLEVNRLSWGDYYVGLSPDSIGDNETGAEFKARVKLEIEKELGIKDPKCHWYCEAEYDG